MTTPEIAQRLVELCRKGDFHQAQVELYADNAVSIEPEESQGFAKETHGLQGIFEKAKKFNEWIEEVHGVETSEPIVAGRAIAFTLSMDVTMKGKSRSKMDEICAYEVKDGKIVLEQFFM